MEKVTIRMAASTLELVKEAAALTPYDSSEIIRRSLRKFVRQNKNSGLSYIPAPRENGTALITFWIHDALLEEVAILAQGNTKGIDSMVYTILSKKIDSVRESAAKTFKTNLVPNIDYKVKENK